MSDEAISLEETNKLRIGLGLRPIPLPSSEPAQISDDSISLSETNKLRISLGLKPIVEEDTASAAQTTEDYQSEIQKDEKDARIKRNLEVAKQKAIKRKKINISKSLLDDDEDVQSTDDWLSKIKKNDKPETTKKVKRVRDEVDSSKGLKVGHNIEDLNSIGTDVVLTLKEKSIFEEDDELESEVLVKQQRLEKELADKLRSNKYDQNGDERNLIDIYEEQLNEGGANDHFVLSGKPIKFDDVVDAAAKAEEPTRNKTRFNLDLDEEDEDEDKPSDYAKAKPIKMKKLKKKGKLSQSRKREQTDEDGDAVLERVEVKDEDFRIQDDEELQSILNLSRLRNQKKIRRKTPEELAREIKDKEENGMDVDEETGGFVIDESTEFLSSIKKVEDDDEEVHVQPDVEKPLFEAQEDLEGKMDIDEEVQPDAESGEGEEDDDNDNEVNFVGGLGSALSFLRSKNIVQEKTSKQLEQERTKRDIKKKQDLLNLNVSIEKRIFEESIKQDPEFLKLTKKEKEEVLRKEMEQFKDVQPQEDLTEQFKDYNPEINIQYIDEDGKSMDQKQAFKHLSHHFHGKVPTKSKVEKKRKKVESDRKNQQRTESVL